MWMKARRGVAGLWLLAAALSGVVATPLAAQEASQAVPAQDAIQSMFDDGLALLDKNEFEAAAQKLYAALEQLRALKRDDSEDAGIIYLFLARALAGLDHAQTNEAYGAAISLLARARDAKAFVTACAELLARLEARRRTADADPLIARMLTRVKASGVADAERIRAMEQAIGFYTRAGREADADAAFETALSLDGTTPPAAKYRGVALLSRSKIHQREGRPVDAGADLDAAIKDLLRAGDAANEQLGTALYARGLLFYEEGLYREALPRVEPATRLLENSKDDEIFLLSAGLRMRLLDRLERRKEALAAARHTVEVMERKHGASARLAVAARLDLVEMLLRAGERDEAARNLQTEQDRFAGKAEPALAMAFFDKLAAIHIADENYAEAIKAAEDAINAARIAMPDNRAFLIEPMRKRAEASTGRQDAAFAERAFGELIAQSQLAFRPDHPEVARDLNAFASYLQQSGRLAEAEPIFRRSVAILERAYGARGAKYAFGLHNLAIALSAMDDFDAAIGLYNQVLEILPPEAQVPYMRAQTLLNLARALEGAGRAQDALATIDEIQRLLGLEATPPRRLAFLTQSMLMSTLLGLGRLPEAWRAGVQALDGAVLHTAEDAQNIVATHLNLALVAGRGGDSRLSLEVARKGALLQAQYGLSDARLRRELAVANVTAALDLGGY